MGAEKGKGSGSGNGRGNGTLGKELVCSVNIGPGVFRSSMHLADPGTAGSLETKGEGEEYFRRAREITNCHTWTFSGDGCEIEPT